MKWNYGQLKQIPEVKRYVIKNPTTDFMQVHFTQGEKHFAIEKIAENEYYVETEREGFQEKKLYRNLLALDLARYAFFEVRYGA